VSNVRPTVHLEDDASALSQGAHYMLSEIREEPAVLDETLVSLAYTCRKVAFELIGDGLDAVYFSGSGTSYHAAVSSNYLASVLGNRPTQAVPASELSSWVHGALSRRSAFVMFSQSGESVDALSAVRAVREAGFRSVAITNTPGSSLSDLADYTIITRGGRENAVTATKTFLCALAAAYLLVIDLAEAAGSINKNNALKTLRREVMTSPLAVRETIRTCEKKAKSLAEIFAHNSSFFLLGHGANYATALEGALKLKESCNVVAEGYAAREFLHGPMQLLNRDTPVIVFTTESDRDMFGPLMIMKTFKDTGAPAVQFTDYEKTLDDSEAVKVAGGLSEPVSPLTFVLPIQLFAYYSAINRGLNPDRPTRLTKVVK